MSVSHPSPPRSYKEFLPLAEELFVIESCWEAGIQPSTRVWALAGFRGWSPHPMLMSVRVT